MSKDLLNILIILFSVVFIIVVVGIWVKFHEQQKNKKNQKKIDQEKIIYSDKYDDGTISSKIFNLIGGPSNVITFNECKTRIKLELKSKNNVSYENDDYVNIGLAGIIVKSDTKLDLIIGYEVSEVAKQLKEQIK